MLPPTESHDAPSREEIYGLATLAGHAGTRREVRIKAIRVLARIPDQNAIRVLGEMALWEEDPGLRQEAYAALESTFGEDLPKVLEGIRLELTGQLGAVSEDEGEGEQPENASTDLETTQERQARRLEPGMPQSNPVTQQEGAPLWLLWAVLGIVVVGGIVIMMVLK